MMGIYPIFYISWKHKKISQKLPKSWKNIKSIPDTLLDKDLVYRDTDLIIYQLF
ncbi:MAG: hypothetical protein II670_14800 [Alphaproteobacteria bacterium]|nr:hypothetical protein [Alphaproteobacteria bacterium]